VTCYGQAQLIEGSHPVLNAGVGLKWYRGIRRHYIGVEWKKQAQQQIHNFGVAAKMN
jgi:hypothetical protein